ncbi:hypothetical protein Hanom_Chr11g01012091 [Helianthus anomalus]
MRILIYVIFSFQLEGERADLNNPAAAPASKVVRLNNELFLLRVFFFFFCRMMGDKSIEIIGYGHMFSSYKSHLQREFIEEDRKCEAQRKRYKRLSEWKWSDMVDLDDSDDDDKAE